MKTTLTETAEALARRHGLINLTRAAVCKAAGIPEGSFKAVAGCNFVDFIARLNRRSIGTVYHEATRSRTIKDLRRENLILIMLGMASKKPYHEITRREVATAAGVSEPLINFYFGNSRKLKHTIIKEALKRKTPLMVAPGVTAEIK